MDGTEAGMNTEQQPHSHDLLALVRAHFNEPMMLSNLRVGRCIGYAEDDCDCYIIMRFPGIPGKSIQEEVPHVIHHTMVGGYYFLDILRNQGKCVGSMGKEWNDLVHLDGDLTRAGVPREAEFTVSLGTDTRPSASPRS